MHAITSMPLLTQVSPASRWGSRLAETGKARPTGRTHSRRSPAAPRPYMVRGSILDEGRVLNELGLALRNGSSGYPRPQVEPKQADAPKKGSPGIV